MYLNFFIHVAGFEKESNCLFYRNLRVFNDITEILKHSD